MAAVARPASRGARAPHSVAGSPGASDDAVGAALMLELARALAEDQEENKFLDADTSMPPAGSPAPVSVNRGKRDGGAIAEWCLRGVLRFSEFDLPIRWRPTRVASIA